MHINQVPRTFLIYKQEPTESTCDQEVLELNQNTVPGETKENLKVLVALKRQTISVFIATIKNLTPSTKWRLLA